MSIKNTKLLNLETPGEVGASSGVDCKRSAIVTMCHIYLLELPNDRAIIFQGKSVPDSVVDAYGTDVILAAARHHFTAAIPDDTVFPPEDVSREEAREWFDEMTQNRGVIFYSH